MGSGSTRANITDDKMMVAIERGDQFSFKDRKPPKNRNTELIKAKEERAQKTHDKTARLKALRLAAEKEKKAS